ncbi:MAG: hypothetical protein N3A59_04090 [Thermodesulfovibrionales bacterium]|nr:hypothetical protein [Thermodesulfovibrionales bacterium]
MTVVVVYAYILKTDKKKQVDGFIGRFSYETRSTIFGALVGLIEDLVMSSFIGSSFLSLGLVGFIGAILFSDVFFRWSPLIGVVLISFFTIFSEIVNVLVRIIFTDLSFNFISILEFIIIQTFINSPFGLFIKPIDMSE